jgi:hypothetical protein
MRQRQPIHGTITATRHQGPLGLEQAHYQWEGGRYARVRRSLLGRDDGSVRVGEVVWAGPYRVRVIRCDFMLDAVTVVPEEPRAWGDLLTSLTAQLIERVYRRLILTAAIWGLANCDPSTLPTWRDLHVIAWAVRQWGRVTRGSAG